MARSSSGLTLMLAITILVAVPLSTMVWYQSWRARLTAPLPPVPTHAELDHQPPAAAPAPAVAQFRPVDTLLFSVFEGRGPPPGKDLLPEGPRVDLEPGPERGIGRVDLDRDGSWDEVWTIGNDELTREFSPNDDGKLTERAEWQGGHWVPVPVAAE
jgi:hypothetical protein